VLDTADYPMRSGLREIAKIHDGDFRLTANQNLIIANVSPANRGRIEELLVQYGIAGSHNRSATEAQFDGVRFLADLRPGLGGKRTISARSGD